MEVQPNSRSLILRATHILVIRVVSADDPAWVPRTPAGEERIVHLRLLLEETMKGVAKQQPGDSIQVAVKQVRIGMAWGPMPGAWSNIPIAPGTQIVAFGQTHSEDAALILNDPAAIQLIPAGEALADVHLAAKAAGLDDLLAAANRVSSSLGWLFADFLWAKYETEAITDISSFNRIVEFMEQPSLNRVARYTLLLSLPTSVLAPDPPATRHIDRLAVAMFRLLAMPEASALHDNLLSTDIPNLLDVPNPSARPAHEVFKDFPNERMRALRTLNSYKGPESTTSLRDWVRR